jgi:hypothetical protein
MKNLVKKFFVFFVLVGMFGGVAAELSEADKAVFTRILAQAQTATNPTIIHQLLGQIDDLLLRSPGPSADQRSSLNDAKRILTTKLQGRRASDPSPPSQYARQEYQPAMAAPQPTAPPFIRIKQFNRMIERGTFPAKEEVEALAQQMPQPRPKELTAQFKQLLNTLIANDDTKEWAEDIREDYGFDTPTPAAAGAGESIDVLVGKLATSGAKINMARRRLEKVRKTMGDTLDTEPIIELEQSIIDAQLKIIRDSKKKLYTSTGEKKFKDAMTAVNDIITNKGFRALHTDTKFQEAVDDFLHEAYTIASRPGVTKKKEAWNEFDKEHFKKLTVKKKALAQRDWFRKAIAKQIDEQTKQLKSDYVTTLGKMAEFIEANSDVYRIPTKNPSKYDIDTDIKRAVKRFLTLARKQPDPTQQLKTFEVKMRFNANQLYAEIPDELK